MGTAEWKRLSTACFSALALLTVVALPRSACAGSLDRIRQDKVIRIAYRADAPPFSYRDGIGEPAGYMVDLCRGVAKRLAQQLNLPSLRINYVTVTAVDRFEAIQENKADLLCEPTSVTLSRRKLVDFSIATFVDGASLMVVSNGPQNLQALSGQTIGVLSGTTTEQELGNSLKNAGVTANVIAAKTHTEGLKMLEDARISAYFADRSILLFLIKDSKAPETFRLADAYLTVEPYALALPKGDEDFRLEVDRALSHIYRSGEIGPILAHTFGDGLQLGPMLQAAFLFSGFPD
jgi:ABC-type amino acid transport substrate-binding protein